MPPPEPRLPSSVTRHDLLAAGRVLRERAGDLHRGASLEKRAQADALVRIAEHLEAKALTHGG